MNPKLLEQIALAKQTGSNAMAKDFFAKTPGIQAGQGDDAPPVAGAPGPDEAEAGGDSDNGPPKPGALGGIPTNAGASNAPAGGDATPQLTPELLQELLALIKQQGGGAGSGPQGQ